jgi:pimeloyl-ACP methyl ester carboxylesterase
MSFIDRSGVSIFYECIKYAAPQPTLLIHGNLASSKWWYPTAEALRSCDLDFASPLLLSDWRGCGQSRQGHNRYEWSLDIVCQDYLAVMDAAGLDKVNVAGHSLGGLIALKLLVIAPERFVKAILLDPVPTWGVTLDPELVTAMKAMQHDRSHCSDIICSTIKGCDPKSPYIQDLIEDTFQVDSHLWTTIPDLIGSTDFTELAKKINHPILVLHGSDDGVLQICESERLAAVLKNATFQRIEGQGHSLNVENPKKFVKYLL